MVEVRALGPSQFRFSWISTERINLSFPLAVTICRGIRWYFCGASLSGPMSWSQKETSKGESFLKGICKAEPLFAGILMMSQPLLMFYRLMGHMIFGTWQVIFSGMLTTLSTPSKVISMKPVTSVVTFNSGHLPTIFAFMACMIMTVSMHWYRFWLLESPTQKVPGTLSPFTSILVLTTLLPLSIKSSSKGASSTIFSA